MVRIGAAIVLVVLTAGCAGFTSKIGNEPIQPVSGIERYNIVEIAPIATAPWVDVKSGDRAKMRASFVEKLRLARLGVAVEDSVHETHGVLVLASLIDYNERHVDDYRGRMRVHVSLIDKATSDTLSQTYLKGKTVKGWFHHPDDRRTGQAIGARMIEYLKSVGFGQSGATR